MSDVTAPATLSGPDTTVAHVRELMGMPVSIHLRSAGDEAHRAGAIVERAYARLAWIDRVFSTYRPDSVVSRIGRGELALADAASAVREVAALCEAYEAETGGVFSAGFRRSEGVDWDPTGLVKGWAVAEAGRVLDGAEGCAWSVNAGGDVLVGGPEGLGVAPWRIGIDDPAEPGRIVEVVELARGAVCTSGTAARGAHLVDPATGRAPGAVGSVTVIGPDVVRADVWATAVFVGTPDLASRLVDLDPAYRVVDQRVYFS